MKHLNLDDVRNRNLGRILELQAQHRGDRVFLIEDERKLTFAQADAKVNSLARGLAGLGVQRGDRVAFYMESAPEVVLLTLAVNKLGAIWVPVNTDYKGAWLEETLVSADAQVIVTDSEKLSRISEVLNNVPHEHLVVLASDEQSLPQGAISLTTLFDNPSDPIDLSEIGHGDVCAILFTSGTTGKSKGVMQSHNVWIRAAITGSYDSGPDDIVYNALPLYNSAAWSANILRALTEGIGCAMDKSFSVSSFWDRIRYYNATQTFTLGAMHIFLWQQPARPGDADNPLVAAGMVPMPQDLIEPFAKRFGMQRMTQGFGQSEVMGLLSREEFTARQWAPNSLGDLVADDLELRLVDDEGKEVPVGEVGEFAVRPRQPHVIFEGYFNNPEATEAAHRDGWYLMGDLGRKDEEGNYFFVDRKKDAVRYKGRNISTMEVESVIRRHPAVQTVAVFGITSEHLDSEDELKADIILKDGATATAEEIARFTNENAPYFFVPRYIEFVDELPYTPTNKVQKYVLRQKGIGENVWDRDKEAFALAR